MQLGFREIHDNIMFKKHINPNFRLHLHEDIELLYVIKGKGTIMCNGTRYNVSDGNMFVAFPNQVHHHVGYENGDYILLIIKPSQLLAYANIFFDGEPTSPVISIEEGEDDNILFLLKTALYEYLRDGYSTVIEGYITTLFGKLLRYYDIKKKDVSRNKVMQILNYCSENYKEPLTVDDVATALSISRSTVSHTFANHVKIGFCDYINMLRLVDARALLRNTDMSITDIAQSVGFETIRTFNRAFLKERGISPSQYRKNQKNSRI